MNSDDLLEQTKASLQAAGDLLTETDIRQVFGEAGILDLLERKAAIESPKRLLARTVYLRGFKVSDDESHRIPFTYRRSLGTGLNLWLGGNDSGKSTILKCILWALTGEEPNIKLDVRQWLTEIAIEFEVSNDQTYTIRFFPRPDQRELPGDIYVGTIDNVLRGEGAIVRVSFTDRRTMKIAVERLFGSLLGFSPLTWVKQKELSVDVSEYSIAWDVYSQALFISDDDYSDYLFPNRNLNGKHHQKTLGMYLGLDLLEAVSKAQAERDRARSDYNFDRKRVDVNAAQVKETLQTVAAELTEVDERLGRLLAGQSILKDTSYLDKVRQRVSDYARQVDESTKTVNKMEADYRTTQSDLYEAERSRQGLGEAIRFKMFLSNLQVEICPRCENQIEGISDEDEIATRTCRVCHSELNPIVATDTQEGLLKETETRIKKLRAELSSIKKASKVIQKDLGDLSQKYEADRVELSRASQEAEAGFSNELQNLLSRKGFLEGRLAELRSQTSESQSDRLEKERIKADILKFAHKHLETAMQAMHRDLLRTLQSATAALAQQFGMRTIQLIEFDSRLNLFAKQHGKSLWFARLTKSEQLRIKLAFHLSLLAMRTESGIGRHPTFLVWMRQFQRI